MTHGSKILVIPDTQVKPGVPIDHMTWLGKYITEIRPDHIVHIGDNFDMPSLSSYDKGTGYAEGRRVCDDVKAGQKALDMLEAPIKALQNTQKRYKKAVYTPHKHFFLGNHEERIARYANSNPALIGTVGYDMLGLEERGWEVYDYLEVGNIEGILFSHYFANPMTGKPYTGRAANLLPRIGKSFVMGHRQELDYTCRELVSGDRQFGLVAGAFYQHEEGYKGYQGNKHWRGVIVLNEANDGWADPMVISMDYLRRRYGGKRK